MKRIILIVSLLITSALIYAQSYNGIAVGNSLSVTKSQILAKGFRYEKSQTSTSQTYYKYVDGQKVILSIVYTPYTKIVWKFLVEVDHATSWMSAKEKYLRYTEILSARYGDHTSGDVTFESPYYDGDGYEIQALYLDKAEVYSVFETQGGIVMLTLDAWEKGTAVILLHYQNARASEINKNEQTQRNEKMY